MNQCVAEMVIDWMANTDFQPAASINGLSIAPKPEKESKSYNDLTKEAIKISSFIRSASIHLRTYS
jgi:hypothetical protein